LDIEFDAAPLLSSDDPFDPLRPACLALFPGELGTGRSKVEQPTAKFFIYRVSLGTLTLRKLRRRQLTNIQGRQSQC
jgi:hypothetical protein